MAHSSEELREIAQKLIETSKQLQKEANDILRRADELDKAITGKTTHREDVK